MRLSIISTRKAISILLQLLLLCSGTQILYGKSGIAKNIVAPIFAIDSSAGRVNCKNYRSVGAVHWELSKLPALQFEVAVEHSREIPNHQLHIHRTEPITSQFIIECLNSKSNIAKMSQTHYWYGGLRRNMPVGYIYVFPFVQVNGIWHTIDSATLHFPENDADENKGGAIADAADYSVQDEVFFSDIVNKNSAVKKLSELRRRSKKNQENILNATSWYQPGKEYVKLTTKNDGIAYIPAEKILELQPSWNNISYSKIHLSTLGKLSRYALWQDSDDKINIGDTIVFIGNRTQGDSTYFNYHTALQPYYCYVDSTQQSLRFAYTDYESASGEEHATALQTFHFEEDYEYFPGELFGSPYKTEFSTEILFGEGYYWKFHPSLTRNETWNISELLPEPYSDIHLKTAYYASGNRLTGNQMNTAEIINVSLLNNMTFDEKRIIRYGTYFTESQNIKQYLFAGANLFSQKITKSESNGSQYYDYTELKGNFYTEAIQGKFSGAIVSDSRRRSIQLDGLRSPRLWILDTVHHTFSFRGLGQSGIKIRALLKSGDNPVQNLAINDSALLLSDASELALAIEMDDGNYRVFRWSNPTSLPVAELRKLGQGKIAAIVCNNPTLLENAMRVELESLGFRKIPTVGSQQAWMGIAEKNARGVLRELSSENGEWLSCKEFITGRGVCYRDAFVVEANKNYGLTISDIASAETSIVEAVSISDLRSKERQADYIIISHSQFKNEAEELAKYRTSQGWNVFVADVDDIYKEFNFGLKSPFAIRDFLRYAYQEWKKPSLQYILLLGNASWDNRKILPSSVYTDFVPTYGHPTSDMWYTFLDGDDFEQDALIGRISCNTKSDAAAVLKKIQQYESMGSQEWLKKFLYIAEGGFDKPFYPHWFHIEPFMHQAPISGSGVVVNDAPSPIPVATRLQNIINDGILWVSYFGHGSPLYIAVDGWQAEYLRNFQKYFFLTTFSCNTGSHANPKDYARNEQYVNAPEAGAIAAMGDTSFGLTDIVSLTQYELFRSFAEDSLRRISDLLHKAIRGYNFDHSFLMSAMQYNILGDPVLSLKLAKQPDLFLRFSDIEITNQSGGSTLSQDDSVITVACRIFNQGVGVSHPITVRLTLRGQSYQKTFETTLDSLLWKGNATIQIREKLPAGNYTVSVAVDPDSAVVDANRVNNVVSAPLFVYSSSLYPLDPNPFQNVNALSPQFRFFLPKIPISRYDFEIADSEGRPVLKQENLQIGSQLSVTPTYVEWTPEITLDEKNHYLLRAKVVNALDEKESPLLEIPFHALNNKIDDYATIWESSVGSELQSYTIENAAVNLNENNIQVLSDSIGIRVESCNGGPGLRHGQITFRNQSYISTPFFSKFAVLVFNPKDTAVQLRNFYTYNHWSEPNPFKVYDGNTEDLYRFLKDSVPADGYIAVSVADASFRGFLVAPNVPGEIGSDSLIYVLKQFGATKIDSVFSGKYYPNGEPFLDENRFIASYSFIGKRGQKIAEDYAKFTDTVTLQSEFSVARRTAAISSSLIGPSLQWDSVMVDVDVSPLDSCELIVVGEDNVPLLRRLVHAEGGSNRFSMSEISANAHPYVRVRLEFKTAQLETSPKFSGMRVQYLSAPELAVAPSYIMSMKDSLLRGDSVVIKASVENISPRIRADSIVLHYGLRSEGGTILLESTAIPILSKNEIYNIARQFSTQNLSGKSFAFIQANPIKSAVEYNYSNNSAETPIFIRIDNEKPRLTVISDGRTIKSGDFISIEPSLEFIISDNAILPIDSNRISVRVNGFFEPGRNARNAKWEYLHNMGEQRGKLSFSLPETLGEDDNNIRIIFEDASGNRDTANLKVWVARDSELGEMTSYPNPTSQEANIGVQFVSKRRSSPCELTIFSVDGREVHRRQEVLEIGSNILRWNGNSTDGQKVAPGVYYAIVQSAAGEIFESKIVKILVVP